MSSSSSAAANPNAGTQGAMGGSPPAPARSALILAFAAIYLIWGSTYLGIRVAVETMPPST